MFFTKKPRKLQAVVEITFTMAFLHPNQKERKPSIANNRKQGGTDQQV